MDHDEFLWLRVLLKLILQAVSRLVLFLQGLIAFHLFSESLFFVIIKILVLKLSVQILFRYFEFFQV